MNKVTRKTYVGERKPYPLLILGLGSRITGG